MRNPLRIVLYVASGFFFYTVGLIAFVNEPPVTIKLAIMGVFAVPAVVFLASGLIVSEFINWRRDTGIVIMSASLFTAVVALNFALMMATPEIRKMFPEHQLKFLSDWVTGCFLISVMTLSGACLIWFPKRPKEA